MNNFFYSHIIEIHTITEKLDGLDLKDDHKQKLAHLVDSTIHQTVLDVILSSLNEKDKELFIEKLHQNPSDKQMMEFLKERVGDIEDQIKSAVKELKTELHTDIEEAAVRSKQE